MRNVSYFMRNVQKGEQIINMTQNKEFLIYLHDSNCQQNSQVFFILDPSSKSLSMIAFFFIRNQNGNIFFGTPCI